MVNIPTPEEDEERLSEMMKQEIKPATEFDEFMEIVGRMTERKIKEEKGGDERESFI